MNNRLGDGCLDFDTLAVIVVYMCVYPHWGRRLS